jgi:hypothetical protein
MSVPTPQSLRRVHRRQARQAKAKCKRQARADAVLAKLEAGAVLYRHHRRDRVIWVLAWKGGSEFLTHEIVTDALASGKIAGVGDTLFEGAPSQTYRYAEGPTAAAATCSRMTNRRAGVGAQYEGATRMADYLYDSTGRQYEIAKKTAKLVFYKSPGNPRQIHTVDRSDVTSSADVLVSKSWYWQRPVWPSEGPMAELRALQAASKVAHAAYEEARQREWEVRSRIVARERAAEAQQQREETSAALGRSDCQPV